MTRKNRAGERIFRQCRQKAPADARLAFCSFHGGKFTTGAVFSVFVGAHSATAAGCASNSPTAVALHPSGNTSPVAAAIRLLIAE